jgi:hypothetical protein
MNARTAWLTSGSLLLAAIVGAQTTSPQTSPQTEPAPASSSVVPPPEAGIIRPQPVGTISELMVRVIYPASDAILYIATRIPENDVQWNELEAKALMVAESANLLMLPGHARDQKQWMADAKLMRDAGEAALQAAKARNVDALVNLNEAVYRSCTTCHQHYRKSYGRRP